MNFDLYKHIPSLNNKKYLRLRKMSYNEFEQIRKKWTEIHSKGKKFYDHLNYFEKELEKQYGIEFISNFYYFKKEHFPIQVKAGKTKRNQIVKIKNMTQREKLKGGE